MILKSIKWRLQLWYGLILVAVLAGFGGTAYKLESNRVFRRVDDEIHRRVDIIAKALHSPHCRQQHGPPDFDDPDPGPPGEGGRPGPGFNRPEKFNLPPGIADLFGTNSPNGFYCVVSGRGRDLALGNIPYRSGKDVYESIRGNPELGPENMKLPRMFTEGEFRDFIQMLPSGRLSRWVVPLRRNIASYG